MRLPAPPQASTLRAAGADYVLPDLTDAVRLLRLIKSLEEYETGT